MADPGSLRERFDRVQRAAWVVGGLAAVAALVGAFVDTQRFFEAYLVAFLFWLAFPLGSLAIVMLHHLTGGSWGFAVRRLLEAATRTLPFLALAFLPIAFGLPYLYEWSRPEVVQADPLLREKVAYLNPPFFWARAAAYFAVWGAFAWALNRLSARQDRLADPRLTQRMRALSGPGIALYGVALTFASLDWAMSLEPHWFSTIYGMLFVVGQALTAFAFAIVVAALLQRREPFSRWLAAGHFHDLGKLMFACVLLWAYMSYSQYLIIWSGNLPEETEWYERRAEGGWTYVAAALIALHFALPFALLLSRRLKRDPRRLAWVAGGLVLVRFVDIWWLVVPAFHSRHGVHLSWLDVVLPVALGGAWIGLFVGQLKGRPLVSLQDAQLQHALEQPAH